jgi:hypothetical protein
VCLIFKRSGLLEAAGLEFRVARFAPWHQEGNQGHDVPWYFPNAHGTRAASDLPEEGSFRLYPKRTELLQSQYGIDRVASRTCDVKQQKTSHDAEVLVKSFHAVDFIRIRHCPIAMRYERCSKRVRSQKCG